MSVIFYGRAGTGKTTAMLGEIKACAEKGENCLLFVPEQFSFDTERAAYFAVGAQNSRFVKVTGFSKYSRELLTRYRQAKPCADDAVKLITMWKAVESVKSELISFSGEKNSAGFCRLMLKTVASFRSGGVSPEELRKALETQSGLSEELADKAEDFLKIYEKYNSALTREMDDKLDDVSRAAALAEQYGSFKGLHLFFDNFDSFSAAQQRLLAAAIPQAQSSVFCFTADRTDSRKREFICVCRTMNDVAALSPTVTYREFKEPFREKGRDPRPVEVYSAKTPYEEAELVCAKIHHMIREEGMRCRDILILVPDSEYEPIITSRLTEQGIPVFSDFPRKMTEKPVVDFVLQVLRSLSFDTEELLRLAESGFKRIRDGEGKPRLLLHGRAYALRRAAEKYHLSAESWTMPWTDEGRKDLSSLEELRKGFISPLERLREQLEQAQDGKRFSEIFMEYLLTEEDIQATFLARSKTGAGGETDWLENDPQTAEEYSRIWDALSEAISSAAFCLEGEKVTVKQYLSLLEEILSGVALANPPAVLDSVTVGDIERTRKAAPKIVMIMGFNEGKIPASSSPQSVFTYFERESLNGAGLPLYDSNLLRCSKEYYFTYRAMNLYGRKMIITYCGQSAAGAEESPSALLKGLGVAPVSVGDMPREYFLNTKSDIRQLMADEEDEELTAALSKLLEEEDFCSALENSRRLLRGERKFRLSAGTAMQLMGSGEFSPTRLEAAFGCPFMYFCRHGLRLREREDADIAQPANMGTLVHFIMRLALEKAGDPKDLTDEEIAGLARDCINEALKTALAAEPSCPERVEMICASLLSGIVSLLKQIRLNRVTNGFVPSEFEKRVSYEITDERLPLEGGKMRVKGIADRIDRLTTENGEYVMIYDYKTGKKHFSPQGIENGSDLQMLLYLFSRCEDRKPAGVSYLKAAGQTPVKAAGTALVSPSEITAGWYSEHSLSGALFDSPEVVNAFAKTEGEIKKITAHPRKNFSDMLSLSADKFGEFRQHIEKDVIVPKVADLLNGNIEAIPTGTENDLPCSYCEFKSCCGNGGEVFREAAGDGITPFLSEKDEKSKKKGA